MDPVTTLSDIFFHSAGAGRSITHRLDQRDGDRIRPALTVRPQISLGDVQQEITDAYGRALETPLAEVFSNAWSKLSEVEQFADLERFPNGERHLVPLAQHRIKSKHEPKIEVLADGKTLVEIPLDVTLDAHFEAAVLAIEAGHIQSVQSAAFRASGEIACRGIQIASVKSRSFALPAHLSLDPPFRIPRLHGEPKAAHDHLAKAPRADNPLAATAPMPEQRPEPKRKPVLTLTGTLENGREVRLRLSADGSGQSWTLGRAAGRADQVVASKTVSSEHARIRYSADSGFEIRDLSSSNGTAVDGKTVDGGWIALDKARVLRLGRCELTIQREG